MEFYVTFWEVLGEDLVCVLNSCCRVGQLSLSQHSGIISLSFKKGDRLDIRYWRPISLLTNPLLQTCGVPGHFIGENVVFLRDVVDYATLPNVPVAVLSLDQEKAFDHVEWSFMRQTLRSMGFGDSFIHWVNLFYCSVHSSVNVNGYFSQPFSLSRGVHQGCPLSPLLYVLVSEVLAVDICANLRIHGLTLPGIQDPLPPISQYADDTSLIVTDDDAIKATFETYSIYERGSGSKLNLSKSKGLWLGSWNGRCDPPVDLDWSSSKFKVLGVFIGVGNLEKANWRPHITAVENVLASWRQRQLSFRGRALVINALALFRVWYVASLIHMPAWVFKELNTLAFNFFWKGKRDLVSRSVVVQPTLFGGFSVVNVKFIQNLSPPHCVIKFLPTFGVLYWSTMWRELFFFDTDHQVIDLSWKIAHGVLYTAAGLASFGYDFSTSCFCGPVSETLEHLFFYCPLAHSVLSWLLSLMFISSALAPSLACRHALFGFSSAELLVVPRIFVYILGVCKFYIWHARNDFRFHYVRPGAASVIENVKTRVRFHLPLHFNRFLSSRK